MLIRRLRVTFGIDMENTSDAHLTGLSWLKAAQTNDDRRAGDDAMSADGCSHNHVDDDLQCLCWVIKIRPTRHSPERFANSCAIKVECAWMMNVSRFVWNFSHPATLVGQRLADK